MTTMKSLLGMLLITTALAAGAEAQSVAIHAWADGYYAWNSDQPEPKLNFFSGVGTTAHRANQLGLNVAALDVARDAKPWGFHVTLVAGDSADVVHAAEPHPHRHPVRNVYQASLSYNAPVGKGLLLEAGVYPSHIGFEGFFSKDNWNYTRGWLGELSPYYQAGVKASYAWNDHWSGRVDVLRGWQTIGDSSDAPAYGTQLAYSDAKLSASFNTYIGETRRFGDLVATYKSTPKLSVAAALDRGHDRGAEWLGVAGYGRYALDDTRAVALRLDRFRDPDAGISGFSQTLSSATLTYEHRPTPRVIVKLEARRDHSTVPVFNGSQNQTLAILSCSISSSSF